MLGRLLIVQSRNYTKDFIRRIRVLIIHLLASCFKRELEISGDIVLIVAPHPDDEVMGCSGLIQSLLKVGKKVYVIILTGGEGSHYGCCSISSSDLIAARRKLAIKANAKIGVPNNYLYFLDYPDRGIHYKCRETGNLDELIKEIHPDVIFIPHKGEGWNDHLQAGNIIRKLMMRESNIRLYEYCVWFWYYNTWDIDWKNAFLLSMNKAEHMLKNKAIDTYIFPKAPCGKPWSGVLPEVFLKANRWNKELYFRIK